MLQFKPGVRLDEIQPQMLLALEVVRQAFSKFNLDTVVTSANDSTHKEGSLHYKGRALDFRTKHSTGLTRGIVGEVRTALHPLGFDVIWEAEGQPNEHLHVEWDPPTHA